MRPSRPEGNRRATLPGHGNPGPSAAGRTEPHAGRAVAGLPPPASPRRRGRSLEAEEFSLDAEAAPVPSDPLPGRDHPMAGDDDRDRVLPERLADRAAPVRLADAARDLAVGHHLAGGHAGGGHEHAALEGRRVAEVEAHVEAPSLAREVGTQLVHDVRRARRRAHHVGADPLPQLDHEGGLALPERDARQPRLARRHEHAADRGRDGAVIDDTPRRRAGVPVQLPERVERPAVSAQLAPALERPEPARERRRAPSIAEQEGDQLVVMSRHRTPPSAARSFLSAWYTLARAASSLPPSVAAISA